MPEEKRESRVRSQTFIIQIRNRLSTKTLPQLIHFEVMQRRHKKKQYRETPKEVFISRIVRYMFALSINRNGKFIALNKIESIKIAE